MSSLKKFTNSNLASSNMVNARRDEAERLERQRLEVNRKLEALMKKYARVTGDRKVARRRRVLGLSPNDWSPTINASGVKRRKPLLLGEKVTLICAAVLTALVAAMLGIYIVKPELLTTIYGMVMSFIQGLIG